MENISDFSCLYIILIVNIFPTFLNSFKIHKSLSLFCDNRKTFCIGINIICTVSGWCEKIQFYMIINFQSLQLNFIEYRIKYHTFYSQHTRYAIYEFEENSIFGIKYTICRHDFLDFFSHSMRVNIEFGRLYRDKFMKTFFISIKKFLFEYFFSPTCGKYKIYF